MYFKIQRIGIGLLSVTREKNKNFQERYADRRNRKEGEGREDNYNKDVRDEWCSSSAFSFVKTLHSKQCGVDGWSA